MAINKLEKVYKVTFIRYTNALNDTVSDWDGKSVTSSGREQYLDVGKEPFLLRESDLEKYRKFGGGYRDIIFVGCIPVEKSNNPPIYGTKDTADKIPVEGVTTPYVSPNYNYTGTPPLEDYTKVTCDSNTKVTAYN